MKRMMMTVDEELLREAVELSGASSKRQAVEIALRELVRTLRRREAVAHAGQIPLNITVEELWEARDQR